MSTVPYVIQETVASGVNGSVRTEEYVVLSMRVRACVYVYVVRADMMLCSVCLVDVYDIKLSSHAYVAHTD